MLKKILFCLSLTAFSFLPFATCQANAEEVGVLARIHWNININTGFFPCYPGPYYYYPYPPCPYPYAPPYWVW